MGKCRVALVEERERSEALKAEASDRHVEEARVTQEKLGKSRKSLAAGRELAAAANLQAENGVKFRDELWICQTALDAERDSCCTTSNPLWDVDQPHCH